MACAVCWKKVLMRNPLNVLGGNLGDFGVFCKGLRPSETELGRYSELTKTSTALARLAVLFVLSAARRLVLI